MTDFFIDGNSIIKQASEILTTSLDGELVMLNLETGRYLGLDDIASCVWAACANPISVTALCNSLIEKYDVNYDTCLTDTLSLLKDLVREGLIVRCDS